MKTVTRQFLKFVFLMHLPTYGAVLFVFLQLGLKYWIAWELTNLVYICIMFPVLHFSVFKK